jgi:predicted peroxiredoxin
MEKFLFVLTRGLEDPVRVTRALQLAKIAKEKGHDVHVFFTDDAVMLAQEGLIDNVMSPSGDEAVAQFTYLVVHNTPFYVCKPCAEFRKIKNEDLVENANFATGHQLIDLAAESKVFTF